MPLHVQATVNLPKLASESIPGLNLEEELKKRLLPSPPPSPREKRSPSLVCMVYQSPISSSSASPPPPSCPLFLRKRKIVLSGPEAQKRLREGRFPPPPPPPLSFSLPRPPFWLFPSKSGSHTHCPVFSLQLFDFVRCLDEGKTCFALVSRTQVDLHRCTSMTSWPWDLVASDTDRYVCAILLSPTTSSVMYSCICVCRYIHVPVYLFIYTFSIDLVVCVSYVILCHKYMRGICCSSVPQSIQFTGMCM